MTVIHAIILAIIEGLTEFLPVSSTGHMILAASLMKVPEDTFTKLFIVAIQLGAILSVVVLYWKRFLGKIDLNFYLKLIVAFIPAAVFGLLLKKYIDILLGSPLVVAIMLIIGGVIFILLDNWFKRSENVGDDEVKNNKQALAIGMFQVLAMVPGVSRSAATIIGGITQKLNKKAAAEFSFFLAVPTMFAATAKDLLDFYKDYKEANPYNHSISHMFTGHQLTLLLVGNVIAFIVALLAIRAFINYLTKHGFKAFGYYRIIVGVLFLIIALTMGLKMVA